jgi:hypothetical protein
VQRLGRRQPAHPSENRGYSAVAGKRLNISTNISTERLGRPDGDSVRGFSHSSPRQSKYRYTLIIDT